MKNKLTILFTLLCFASFGQTYKFSNSQTFIKGIDYTKHWCDDSITVIFTKDSMITKDCKSRTSIGQIPFTVPKEPNCKKRCYWGASSIHVVSIYKDSIIYETLTKDFKVKYFNQ